MIVKKRKIALLLSGVIAINMLLPIVSVAEPGDRDTDFDRLQEEVVGPGHSEWDLQENDDDEDDYEDIVDKKSPIKEESDGSVSSDEIKRGTNIDLDIRDLVVTEKLPNSSSGRVRVAEVYSINNNLADCYYKPKMEEITNLNAYVLKYGQYAAAYMGFYDIGHKEVPKPSGMQSRALEIIGYDCLLSEEEYDMRTKKYRRTLVVDGGITEETAIMNIYKALGVELRDIKMYHEKANFTKENSPAAALLARDPVKYSLKLIDGTGTLSYIDVMDSFNTYVFVTRTNPELYMRKLNQDFNIPMSQSKDTVVTLADFIIMCKKMMEYYGEPVMNETEMNQLLQVYGSKIPTGLTDELRDAWLYLKARGVLNCDDSGLFVNLTLSDMNDILMCIKDKDSRTNFKEIQVTMNIGDELVKAGYFPDNMSFTQTDRVPMKYDVDYSTAELFDYLIPISDEYAFMGSGATKVPTMYVSEDPNGQGTELPGASYVGVVDNKYWHFIIPAEVSMACIKSNKYIRIDTPGVIDTPDCLYLELGGGYYKKSQKIGNQFYFIRHPFENGMYDEYVDVNRKTGEQWDSSNWGEDKENNGIPDLPEYNEESKPTVPNVEDSDWNGIDYTFYKDITWELEESTGKWRLYYKDDDDDKMMANGEIVRVGASSNAAEEIYYINGDGYVETGWYDWGSQWLFFNDGQVDGFKYGQMVFALNDVMIDGQPWSFDMYGWLIGEEWGNPEEGDQWENYDNLEGEWHQDGELWWFMMADGTWPTSSIEKINDKLYMFDDSGYMLTGWREWDDGEKYYFYPEEGHMARNTVTPDGIRVDLNGIPVGRDVVQTALNIPVIRETLTFLKHGYSMTSYADTNYGYGTSNMGYKDSKRWYILKVPMLLIEDDSYNAFETWYNAQRQAKPDSNKPLRKGKDADGTDILVIQTMMRPDYVFGHITYKQDSSQYSLLENARTISSLNGNYLVNFDDLVALGVFDEGATFKADSEEIIIYGIQQQGTNSSIDSASDSILYGSGQQNIGGFGEIFLRNKTGDKRIKVGTTVYSLPDDTMVFTFMTDDSDSTFNYVDGLNNNKAEDTNTGLKEDSLLYGSNGTQLYVDFRVAYGWATSELSFYQCMAKSNDTTETSKNVIVSYGKDVKLGNCSIRHRNQSGTVTNQFKTNILIGCKTADGKTARLLPMVNNYSCASFALADTPLPSGGHALMCVQYVPACEDTKNMNQESQEDLTKFGKLSVPKFDGYYRKLTNITNLNGGIQDISEGSVVEYGKWYHHSDFGYVYCLPEYDNGVQAENDFYEKWLKTGEYLLPLCYYNSSVVDMSMPYFPTAGYGKQPTNIAASNPDSCVPNVAGVSYLMWDQQLSSRSISELTQSAPSSDSAYYFGSMASLVVKKGTKNTLKIQGLLTNNNDTVLEPGIADKLKFIKVDSIRNRRGGNDVSGVLIYVTVPEAIQYDTVSDEAKELTKVTLGRADGLSDIFKDFEAFTFQDLIKKIDESESFLVLFSIVVLPYIGFVLSLIVFGLALCADAKPVQWFCNNIIDPIKILTVGKKDCNTVGGIKFFGCVLCITVGFALAANGNILRVIMWFTSFFSEVFRLWQML